MPKPPPRRTELQPGDLVAVYARDSGGWEQERSVDQQVEELHRHCAERGYIIAAEFLDRARVGSNDRREGFEALIDHLHSNPGLAGVLVWSMSRLARDQDDFQYHVADLRRRGFFVGSISDNIPGGDFQAIAEAFIAWRDSQYLKTLSKDVKRGLQDLFSRGYWHGGSPPRGYKVVSVPQGTHRNGKPRMASKLVIDDLWAGPVREAFRLRAAGASYQQVIDRTGIYPRKTALTNMFGNEIYIGVLNRGGIRVEDAFPALIDRQLWDAVQAVQRETDYIRAYNRVKRSSARFVLSGLLIHKACGERIHGTSSRRKDKRYRYYRCRQCCYCTAAAPLERRILQSILSDLLNPARIQELADELASDQDDGEALQLENRLSETNAAIQRLARVVELSGNIEELAGRIKALNEERTRLSHALFQARQSQQVELTPGQVRETLEAIIVDLQSNDYIYVRGALRAILSRIIIDDDDNFTYESRLDFC